MIRDETSVLREVLLGPPDHFEWRPTSAISRAALASGVTLTRADVATAHAEMVEVYERCGVEVRSLEADPALPYQVFSRDSSVWGPDGPVVTALHQSWRRGEYAAVQDFYAGAGIEVAGRVTAGALEGGDLVLPAPGVALLGHCEERTELPAAEQLAGRLREGGWEVRLQPFDPHFVHIDVLCCVAAPGVMAVCLEAAPAGLEGWLRGLGLELLDVSYGDAFALGANLMALGGDRVLSTAGAAGLNERLRALGLEVFDPDLWPFTMGGGGPHCLAQPLRRDG